MLRYILKRVLIFIPTLIVISLVSFMLSVNAPGDPVEQLSTSAQPGEISTMQTRVQKQEKDRIRHQLGLDLPLFYMSIAPASYPDTLYRIIDRTQRNAVSSLLNQYGNWQEISAYRNQLLQLLKANEFIVVNQNDLTAHNINEVRDAINELRFTCLSLLSTADNNMIEAQLQQLAQLYPQFETFAPLKNSLTDVSASYHEVLSHSSRWKNYFPAVHFYGNNQYDRWLFGDGNWLTGQHSIYTKGILRGDLGTSYQSGRKVSELISTSIGWSLLFTFISLLIGFSLSIPIGLKAARYHGSLYDRSSSVILFALHSMPTFWISTLLLMLLANTDVLHWFPASGIMPTGGYPEGASFFEKVKLTLPFLVLPAIAYTYSTLAYISRIMRVSALEIIHQDFIRTARAKGLPENKVINKHTFRNALLPIVTLFGNILPAAIGGSVIIEIIFNIPGMGQLNFRAIQTQDLPVIVGVFTIAGVLTLAGYLLSDILYALVDPRISYSNKRA